MRSRGIGVCAIISGWELESQARPRMRVGAPSLSSEASQAKPIQLRTA